MIWGGAPECIVLVAQIAFNALPVTHFHVLRSSSTSPCRMLERHNNKIKTILSDNKMYVEVIVQSSPGLVYDMVHTDTRKGQWGFLFLAYVVLPGHRIYIT